MTFSGLLDTGDQLLPRSVALEAREDGLYLRDGFGAPHRLKWNSLTLKPAGGDRYVLHRRFRRRWSLTISTQDAVLLGQWLDGAPLPDGSVAQAAAAPPPISLPGLLDRLVGSDGYRPGTRADQWTGLEVDARPGEGESGLGYRSGAARHWTMVDDDPEANALYGDDTDELRRSPLTASERWEVDNSLNPFNKGWQPGQRAGGKLIILMALIIFFISRCS